METQTRSLTYAELGAALGITPASAKRLSIRHHWPKHPGNDGKARVTVPLERLTLAEAAAGDDASDEPEDIPGDTTGDVSVTVTALVGQLDRVTAELAAARERLAAVEDERDTARATAAQVEALRAVLDVERQRVTDAKAEAERWRQSANAPRGVVAWLASARAALRG